MNLINLNAVVRGDAFHVELFYPKHAPIKAIQIGLCDVRAADDIRVEYDFDRDGWVIKQPSRFSWPADDPVCDPGWREVAFVEAWGQRPEGV